jgi:penicillin-binding protein 1C
MFGAPTAGLTPYWFANENFIGAAKPNVALGWEPAQPGLYLVRVVDDHGRADARELNVAGAP